ncbi:MAG: diacylglycerol kinase, partial [Burkholderiaceae bacterium]
MSDNEQPISQFKSKSGIKRVFSAFFYSLDGFRAAWRYEHAFRQELMIAVPGVIVALL